MQCEYCCSLVFSAENPLSVDRITPLGGTLEANCPSCDVSLSTGQLENRPAMYCGQCYGILIKNEFFGAVVRERRARRIGAESRKPLDVAAYHRQICCPACQRQMEVHPYYGPGNVIIDSCSSCEYVWLDHGELRSVEQAEGSTSESVLPVFVNGDGQMVIVPEPGKERPILTRSPFAALAEAFWGI